MNPKVKLGIGVFSVLYFLILFLTVAIFRADSLQWDFRVFYSAGSALLHGIGPFDTDLMHQLGIGKGENTYVYPPLIAFLFLPWALLPLPVSAFTWCSLKIFLLWISYKILGACSFVPKYFFGPILFFSIFALNGALVADLISGNITVIQLSVLSIATADFINRKFYRFSIWIGILSFFKLQPILLLVPLFFLPLRQAVKTSLSGFSVLLVFMALNSLFMKDQTLLFIDQAIGRVGGESGVIAPSSFTFFQSFSDLVQSISTLGLPLFPNFGWVPYALHVSFTLLLLLALRTKNGFLSRIENDPRLLQLVLALGIFSFFMIAPRLKNYDYLLALPAILFLSQILPEKWILLIATIFCLPHMGNSVDPFGLLPLSPQLGPVKKVFRLLLDYWPLVCVYVAWWLTFLHLWLYRAVNTTHKNAEPGPLSVTNLRF